MSKYAALKQYLEKQTDRLVVLSFNVIEEIIEAPLPNSAKTHQAWWSASAHPHAQTWEESGYKAVNVGSNQRSKQMEFYDTKLISRQGRVAEHPRINLLLQISRFK